MKYLDCIVLMDVGVGESDGPSVVGNDVRNLVGTHGLSLDSAELESSFFLINFVGLEPTLDIVEDTEIIPSFLNRDDVHHAKRESVISSNLPVDLNQTFLVLNDSHGLFSAEGILQSVLEENSHWKALSKLVRSATRSASVLAA